MDSKNMDKLDISELKEGFPGLTKALGESFTEAGAVCLEVQDHKCGVIFVSEGDYNHKFHLHWPKVSEQMLRAWNDLDVAAESGAYGIAFLLIKRYTNYTVLERSRKGTGFDYWLGNDDEFPFQNKARLEVSGIGKNKPNSYFNARVKQKLEQTKPTDGLLPAYVVVVDFSKPKARVIKK